MRALRTKSKTTRNKTSCDLNDKLLFIGSALEAWSPVNAIYIISKVVKVIA